MGLPRGHDRASTRPPKPAAAERFRECLQALASEVKPTPEELARIERAAQAAPYRRGQLELPV